MCLLIFYSIWFSLNAGLTPLNWFCDPLMGWKQSEKHGVEDCCFHTKPAYRLWVSVTQSISKVPVFPTHPQGLQVSFSTSQPLEPSCSSSWPFHHSFQDECREHTLGSGRERESKRARVSVNKGVAWTHQEIIHPWWISHCGLPVFNSRSSAFPPWPLTSLQEFLPLFSSASFGRREPCSLKIGGEMQAFPTTQQYPKMTRKSWLGWPSKPTPLRRLWASFFWSVKWDYPQLLFWELMYIEVLSIMPGWLVPGEWHELSFGFRWTTLEKFLIPPGPDDSPKDLNRRRQGGFIHILLLTVGRNLLSIKSIMSCSMSRVCHIYLSHTARLTDGFCWAHLTE